MYYIKKKNAVTDGLKHFYPFRKNMEDVIGGQHGYGRETYSSIKLAPDRFGKANRALKFEDNNQN